MTRRTQFRKSVATALTDRSGAAVVEFALVSPLILILMVGAIDITLLIFNRTDMFSAVQSGIQYFMVGGKDIEEAEAIVDSMWHTRPEGATLSVERFCMCGDVQATCLSNCPDQSQPVSYHRIKVWARYKPLLMEQEFSSHEIVRTR